MLRKFNKCSCLASSQGKRQAVVGRPCLIVQEVLARENVGPMADWERALSVSASPLSRGNVHSFVSPQRAGRSSPPCAICSWPWEQALTDRLTHRRNGGFICCDIQRSMPEPAGPQAVSYPSRVVVLAARRRISLSDFPCCRWGGWGLFLHCHLKANGGRKKTQGTFGEKLLEKGSKLKALLMKSYRKKGQNSRHFQSKVTGKTGGTLCTFICKLKGRGHLG